MGFRTCFLSCPPMAWSPYGSNDLSIDLSQETFEIGMLRDLGYFYTGSDMFRSGWDRIYSGKDPLCLHMTGSKLERYGSTQDHLHKWTHPVLESRSNRYRTHHNAYLYQFRTGSKWIRSCVNAALKSSFKHRRKHVLRSLQLYVWRPG